MIKKIYKIFAIVMTLQLGLNVFSPLEVKAHDATVIEPLIEPITKSYRVNVFDDKPGLRKHYENRYINFDGFYTSMCNESKTSMGGFDYEKFATNPTICSGLDDTIMDTDTGYDFFMKAEGYRGVSGLQSGELSTDDTVNSQFTTSVDSNGLRVLTFPGKHGGGGVKDVTPAETDYALQISSTLNSNLNSMLAFINNGKKFQSVSELVNKSILIRPTDKDFTIVKGENNVKNFIIVYGTLDVYTGGTKSKTTGSSDITNIVGSTFDASNFWNTGDFPNVDNDGNLLAYVIPVYNTNSLSYDSIRIDEKTTNDEIASFVWAMPKGYTKIDGIDNSLKFTNDKREQYKFVENGDDVAWITIHQLTMYANNAYKNFNLSFSTKSIDEDSSLLLSAISEIIRKMMDGLRSILGLSDSYTLVFNKGVRGTSNYNYGAMPDSWWIVVLRYHIIFQALAWFFVITGMIKTLIDINLSTINPQSRMHLYKVVEKMIVIGFGLVLVIPITQFLLAFNNAIVGIFATQVDPNAVSPPVIGTFAGIIVQASYLGIVVYMNFVYIMRSIVIGILVAMSPLAISSMAFSQKSDMFTTFLKELLANIFMQSIHAFALAFLTNLVVTGSGLENIVVAYSIIPLTELARGLIFQGAGSQTQELGKKAAAKANKYVKGAASTTLGTGADFLMNKLQENDTEGAEGSGSKSGSGGRMGSGLKIDALREKVSNRLKGVSENSSVHSSNENTSNSAKMGMKAKGIGADLLRAGVTAASGAKSMIEAASDIVDAEMTNSSGGYESVGSNMAKAAGAGLSIGGGVAKKVLKTAKNNSNSFDLSNYDKNNEANQFNSYESATRNNRNIQKFHPISKNTSYATTQDGGLVTNIPSSDLNYLANANTQMQGFYQDLQTMNNDESSFEPIQQHYKDQHINISRSQNGLSVEYTKPYMQRNDFQASVSPNGKVVAINSLGGMPQFNLQAETYKNVVHDNNNGSGNYNPNQNSEPKKL